MNQIASYEKALNNMSPKQWASFLMENAFVSGSDINIELAETFARVGTLMDFKHFVRNDQAYMDERSAEIFLTYCGVLGYGTYLSKYYDYGLLNQLRERANDPRLLIQQAVRRALQYIGQKNLRRLVDYTSDWKNGSAMEQRICLAAFCSPELLKEPEGVIEALEILEWITSSFIDDIEWSQNYEDLQNELAVYWSVVVAEHPHKGKQIMERWMKEPYPSIHKIMKESLLQDSFKELDPDWVSRWMDRL